MSNITSRSSKKRQSSVVADIPQLRPEATKEVLALLTLAASTSKSRHFIGFNSIIRNIEKKVVAVVFICHDAPVPIKEALYTAATIAAIPIRILYSATSELIKIYSVQRISCVALSSTVEGENEASGAIVDGVLDVINAHP